MYGNVVKLDLFGLLHWTSHIKAQTLIITLYSSLCKVTKMLFFKLVIIFVLSWSVTTSTSSQSLPKSSILNYCGQIYTLDCFKLDVANWIDRFGVNEEIFVVPGVSMVLNSNSVEVTTSDTNEELGREFSKDSKEAAINDFLRRKLEQFINGRSLKINLMDLVRPDNVDESGRGSNTDKKSDGGAMMILMSSAMVLGVLATLAMGGLTALAGKALITGAVSLVLSVVLGIKEVTSKETPQVLAQPVISLDNLSGASSSR